ncbi:hypothetical protein D6C86_01752 [Aureobasidium pullulans]|uniref:Uncharacterized protein n=1 Tax=Aureobasidium pullulans TaxID=5580 RepID=A0A4S9V827_AURPU|nr:hypothetical protein D6C94_00768 [Aureobasidium pullulans]THZ47117.1 hypothetical protein D6C87_01605 [Aureobasidium pullulans]THZ65593.1 hypothetical protein D6C86_01752 [Aureobasidium pullulans]CAD0045524.1 unnamed protein product [Aureobasidium pullulans]
MAGLHALFPYPAEASSLDLSGLAGWGFTLKELRNWLHRSAKDSRDQLEKLQDQADDIADSWDQDASSDDSDSIRFSIPPSLDTDIQHLTKLSLAYPPSSISWTDLLSLSKNLHTITHLSLAHWPLPTRTPNSTSPYASLDRDFEEPALVLRMLAENTYCLRWLDLQACHSWLPALIHRSYVLPLSDSEDWTPQQQRPTGPNWNGSWRHLTYLNISQDPSSWFPTNTTILKPSSFRQKMAKTYFRIGVKHQQIIDDLRDHISTHPAQREFQINHCGSCHPSADLGDCWEECADCNAYLDMFVGLMARWLERETEARTVARGIIAARQGTGVRCAFDHGWQVRESYPVLNWV